MIVHTEAEIGIYEEDDFTVIGLRGMTSGQHADLSLQLGRNLDQQDIQLGFDKLYIDYNQLGGYGLVKRVSLLNDTIIQITLDSDKARRCGIPDDELEFNFVERIESSSIDKLRLLCSSSDTAFEAR